MCKPVLKMKAVADRKTHLYCRLAYSYKIVVSRAALIENNRVDKLSAGI